MVKGLIFAAIGVMAALTIYYRVPHYLDAYSQHGLPTEYQGPKFRFWKNGVEV